VGTLLEAQRLDEALAFLERSPPEARTEAVLHDLSAALFRAGRDHECLRLCEELVERFHSQHGAYNAACVMVRLQDRDAAFGWLERALALGANDRSFLTDDEDIAPLREDPRFSRLLARLDTGAAGRA
jgi:hypothetical protein